MWRPQLPGREKFDLALLFALGMLCEDWEVRNFLEEERATWPCRLPWGCFVKTPISNPGRVRHSMRTLSDVDVADVVAVAAAEGSVSSASISSGW